MWRLKQSSIGRLDPSRCVRGWDVLPKSQHDPTSLVELMVRVCVPRLVALHLPLPPVAVCARLDVVLRTAVPEAPVHEDSEPNTREGDVNGPAVVARHLDLHAVPESPSVQL